MLQWFLLCFAECGCDRGWVGGWVDISGRFVHFCEIKQGTVYQNYVGTFCMHGDACVYISS